MENAVAIVRVHNTFQEVLDWWNYCNMCGKEERTVGKYCAETTHDEEEKLYEQQENRPVNKFIEDNSQSPV